MLNYPLQHKEWPYIIVLVKRQLRQSNVVFNRLSCLLEIPMKSRPSISDYIKGIVDSALLRPALYVEKPTNNNECISSTS